jgi:hypothetical protein
MFSSTTIESSTRIPITSDIARRVIRFREYPNKYIAIKVESNDAGMATKTMIESRMLWRNNNITAATRTTAIIRWCVTASGASRVNSEVSSAMMICTPLLSYFFSIEAIFLWSSSLIFTAFALLCFLMLMLIPSCPLKRLIDD